MEEPKVETRWTQQDMEALAKSLIRDFEDLSPEGKVQAVRSFLMFEASHDGGVLVQRFSAAIIWAINGDRRHPWRFDKPESIPVKPFGALALAKIGCGAFASLVVFILAGCLIANLMKALPW